VASELSPGANANASLARDTGELYNRQSRRGSQGGLEQLDVHKVGKVEKIKTQPAVHGLQLKAIPCCEVIAIERQQSGDGTGHQVSALKVHDNPSRSTIISKEGSKLGTRSAKEPINSDNVVT
jgi:hypothetical protein